MQRLAICLFVVFAAGLAGCTGSGAGGTPAIAPTAVTPAATPGPTTSPASTQDPEPTPVPTPAPPPTPVVTGDLVDVAKVTCGDGAPTLGSGRVRTSRDGLTIDVTGTTGWYLGIDTGERGEGAQLERDRERFTFLVPPGDMAVSCAAPGSGDAPTAMLRLEDPDGWYRSVALDPISGSCMSGEGTFTEDARGPKGDPVELAKEALGNLVPGDVVERGGYPADTGLVRVVRDGHVIGVLRYTQDPDGGWLLPSTTMCAGLAVSLE